MNLYGRYLSLWLILSWQVMAAATHDRTGNSMAYNCYTLFLYLEEFLFFLILFSKVLNVSKVQWEFANRKNKNTITSSRNKQELKLKKSVTFNPAKFQYSTATSKDQLIKSIVLNLRKKVEYLEVVLGRKTGSKLTNSLRTSLDDFLKSMKEMVEVFDEEGVSKIADFDENTIDIQQMSKIIPPDAATSLNNIPEYDVICDDSKYELSTVLKKNEDILSKDTIPDEILNERMLESFDCDDLNKLTKSLECIEKQEVVLGKYYVSSSANISGLRRTRKRLTAGTNVYQMEDENYCKMPWFNSNSALFCVFDGHSGKNCALAAKELIPKFLKKYLENEDLNVGDDGQVGTAKSLDAIFRKVYSEVDEAMLEFEYEGSTCTTVFLYENSSGRRYVQAANVGDSSSILIDSEKVIELTQDHHPDKPQEIDRLLNSGVELNPGQTRINGLAVSRALGDHFPKSVECGIVSDPFVSPVYEITKQSTHIIVATDGLWDVLSFNQAYEIIKNLSDISVASQTLLNQALQSKDCTDNLTVIVVSLN